MLSSSSPFFYTSAVNGPPRGDASAIGSGFRVATVYSAIAPQPPSFGSNGAWKPVLEGGPYDQGVAVTATATAPGLMVPPPAPVSPETVALALKSVGNAQPPVVLP